MKTLTFSEVYRRFRNLAKSDVPQERKIHVFKRILEENRYLHDYVAAEYHFVTFLKVLYRMKRTLKLPYIDELIDYHLHLWEDNDFVQWDDDALKEVEKIAQKEPLHTGVVKLATK